MGRALFLCSFLCFALVCRAEEGNCGDDWVGADCSIYSHPTNEGEIYTGDVEDNKWKIYFINVNEFSTVTATLTQIRSDHCDLDFYAKADGFPSFDSFLVRDILSFESTTLTLEGVEGAYFFGVFGYVGCGYNFVFTTGPKCKCASSANGACEIDSSCTCFPGYAGPTCEVEYTDSPSGQQNARVQVRGWNYYGMQVHEQPLRLQYVLNLGGEDQGAHAADIYVAAGRPPTRDDYDFRSPPGGEQTSFTIVDEHPRGDTMYFFGVYSGATSTYYATGTIFPVGRTCINQCSLHGNCHAGTCTCQESFDGVSCDKMIVPLPVGVPVSGFAGKGSWNQYWLSLFSLTGSVVKVEQTSNDSDCDLYVKKGSEANRFNYDYSDISLLPSFYLTTDVPGVWHIGVYGYSDCEYNLTVHETVICSCTPVSHGACDFDETVCICEHGWSGVDCTEHVGIIDNGMVLTRLVVERLGWVYFALKVPAFPLGMTLTVIEQSTIGHVWVYVGVTDSPTLSKYDFCDISTKNAVHTLAVVGGDAETVVMIGIYGNPDAVNLVEFDMMAYYTPA